MTKFTACLTIIFLFVALSYAQTKTVKGNYCGQSSGNRGGEFGFRVGSKVRTFQMNFGQEGGNAKMVRFNINKLKVGDEFIVKYNSDEFIVAITGTGKRKKIEPCTLD
jgi:hypothetical protein